MENNELERLKALASAGSSEATFLLCDHYLAEKEYVRAFEVIKRLENTQNKDVYRKLGYFYSEGIGVATNLESAVGYYQKAYELGDYLAGYNLALMFYRKQDYISALPYLVGGASNNHEQSIRMLAEFYYKGLAVNKDFTVAFDLYKRLYDKGDKKWCYALGDLSAKNKEFEKANEYFLEGVNNGDIRCIRRLAVNYLTGEGINKNFSEAARLLKLGERVNDSKCIRQLAILYREGAGVEKDLEKSEALFKKADEIDTQNAFETK